MSAKLGMITVELFKIVRWDECKARPRFDSKSVVNPRHVHELDHMGDHHTIGYVGHSIHWRDSVNFMLSAGAALGLAGP